jgi:hypothetical protein
MRLTERGAGQPGKNLHDRMNTRRLARDEGEVTGS